jgi:hypothetical protein
VRYIPSTPSTLLRWEHALNSSLHQTNITSSKSWTKQLWLLLKSRKHTNINEIKEYIPSIPSTLLRWEHALTLFLQVQKVKPTVSICVIINIFYKKDVNIRTLTKSWSTYLPFLLHYYVKQTITSSKSWTNSCDHTFHLFYTITLRACVNFISTSSKS